MPRKVCGWYHARMSIVIVGLGNPGAQYERTRHNAGRLAVVQFVRAAGLPESVMHKTSESLVSKGEVFGESVIVVLPETLMNRSGKSVAPFVKSVKAAKNLIVVRDDLDLPLGTIKMTFGRGSGGHKGVESIMRALKTDAFVQIKVGISAKTPKGKTKKPSGEEKVIKHVLGTFSPTEEPLLKKTLKKVVTVLELYAELGIEKAMQEANTK